MDRTEAESTRVYEPHRVERATAPGMTLTIVEGEGRGAQFQLGTAASIGSAAGNDVRLEDSTVSRVHVKLTVERSLMRLRDAGSTNGTFVDGVRVRDAYLVPGSLIKLGATTLRADAAREEIAIELAETSRLGDLVGASARMRQIYSVIERVAPTDTTVLVQGETGTGKELVARAIHERSSRSARRFLAVDCGAIPDNLVESELFGHVRGAFSGAVQDRAGAFEEADGGTLFFDEIGELTPAMQRKLLRALETREIRRLGTSRERKVDVRVVAATNRDLATATNEGLFREDLYFRLAVVTIELPPLRSRREDIPVIAQHFLDRLSGGTERVTPELVSSLLTRSWAGNVRELRNFLERRASLGRPRPVLSEADKGDLEGAHAEMPVRLDLPFKEAQAELLEAFETRYLRALLARTGGNVTRAAEVGGMSRRFLQRRMAELGLRRETSSDEPADG